MNRENKRKQYQKGYYKTHACDDSFTWQGVRPSGRTGRRGVLHSNRAAADDNPMKLMSIAMKPVAFPPFPLERIEEMTALMGGDGKVTRIDK